jgi:gliding motility-associated-like protein
MSRRTLINSLRKIITIFLFVCWNDVQAQQRDFGIPELPALLDAKPALLNADKVLQQNNILTAACNTSTFYLRITAAAGEKINVREIQTLPNGNYLLTGNIILSNLEEEGLICIMSNSGTIIQQQRLRINGNSTTLFAAKPQYDGSIFIAGSVHGANDATLVCRLNNNLAVTWVKLIDIIQAPTKVSFDILPNSQFTVAAQAGNNIIYSLLDINGSVLWQKQIAPAGMDALAGVGHSDYGDITIVVNCTRSGKKVSEFITFTQSNGNIKSSHTPGLNTDEHMFYKVSSFGNRFVITGIIKPAGNPSVLAREITYNSNPTETVHRYSIPLQPDFSCTAAHDNAGDAEGFCFPQQGKLVFIKHFASNQIAPERTIAYDIPVGSNIAGMSRSLVDGGYLFGLNSINQDTVTLIKTDSIGILAGCGYTSIANNYTETIITNNTPTNNANSNIPGLSQTGNLSFTIPALNLHMVCNEQYCPPSPPDDTCQSTYFKALRSNSYADAFSGYFLLNNNIQFCGTARYDRILESNNTVTYGLKLFSERGDFIKGVNVFANGESTSFKSFEADDHHVLLMHYTSNNTTAAYTFTLVNDSLQVVWSKPVQIFAGYNFTSPFTFGDLTRDNEGNFYYVANSGGFHLGNTNEDARVLIYKLDANGNEVWLKVYEVPATHLTGGIAITATNTSLVIVVEGGVPGSVSLQVDKNTGQMLHAYTFSNNMGGAGYNRFLKFDNDRIFYSSNDVSDISIIGVFDTTARLIKMKKTNLSHIAKGNADAKDGKFYMVTGYYNGSTYKDVFLKIDTALNPILAKEYDVFKRRTTSGLWVNDNGAIYTAGNLSYGGVNSSYYDPFFRKFDTSGNTGTCAFANSPVVFTDYPVTVSPITYIPLARSFTPGNVTIQLTPDYYGQQIAEVLCSSSPLCNSVDLTGPVTICQLNQPFTYTAHRNPGCNLASSWLYDPSFAILQNTTDTSAVFKFIRLGNTRIYTKINTGCNFYIDSVDVLIQNVTGSFSLGRDTSLCPADTLRLNAGTGFNSYLWQDGSSDSVFIVRTAGQYFVTVSNLCGNIYKDTINVTLSTVPYLYIGKDSTVCKGDTLQLIAQPGFSNYTWLPPGTVTGTGQQVYCIPTVPVTISVKATTAAGCSASDTININILTAPPVFLGNDTAFCITDSLLLNAGPGYISYLWNNSNTSSSIVIKQGGLYWVKAISSNGCIVKDSITVLPPYALPQPKLGADFTLCIGQQRTLNPGNFSLYKWQDGSIASNYTIKNPGTYYVTVTDSHKCIASDTVIMSKLLPPPSDFLKASDTVCQYSSITVSPVRGFSSYLWSNNTFQKATTITTAGIYTLTVTDSAGCSGKDTIQVIGKTCFTGVFIPNAFTPNSDSRNDIFKPTVFGVTLQYRLQVFSRYGELVFNSNDPSLGWDGNYKGNVQPGGAYTWQCWYQLPGAEPVYKRGSVLLLR